jgi:hypothetical protein
MAKLYFYDTGLVCNLLELESKEQLNTHYLRGALFENLAILELAKARCNRGRPPHLYFWRDRAGHEVDCLAEWGGKLRAIEIKASSTFSPDLVKNVHYFNALAQSQPMPSQGYLVYSGVEKGSYLSVELLSIAQLSKLVEE